MNDELTRAALKIVTEVLPVQTGEEVVITADDGSDNLVVAATADAASRVGASSTVIQFQTLPNPCMDPPPPAAHALLESKWWIDFATAYLLYSPAYFKAIDAGCRHLALGGMDVDMMVRTIGRVNYQALEKMKYFLNEISQGAEIVRVTSQLGTELTMKVKKAEDPFFSPPPETGGYAVMLGGQSGFLTIQDSFEGTLVFDGCISPPEDIGLLNSPLELQIEAGEITKINGGAEAERFTQWLDSFNDPLMYKMDHACYGFNPGVPQPTGRILEDERVFGCMQFGIGPAWDGGAPSHTDGVVLGPSVWVDELQIEEQGVYVHPVLVELCREMGAPGY